MAKIMYAGADASETESNEGTIAFHVYASANDGRPCGYLVAVWQSDRDAVTFLTSPFDIEVETAWKAANQAARQHGLVNIVIYDPTGLFPGRA